MANEARNGKNQLRLVITVALVAMLVVGCAWAGMQWKAKQDHYRQNAELNEMYRRSSTAQAEATPEANVESDKNDEEASLQTTVAAVTGNTVSAVSGRESKKVTRARGSVKSSLPNIEYPTAEDGRPMQYDFYELYYYNRDIVGWIEVGTHLSMPVVYRDNEFYLTHDYYGNPDKAGTLFINEANTIWPADANLLFHGHNMRDGSIFGDLDDYRNLDYLKENVIVTFRTIYDETEKYYVIFSLFDASMNSATGGYFDVGYINFDNTEEFNYYTGQILNRNYFNMPFGVREGDHMLTLLTCSYSNDNGRFMLFCRELREDETVAGILEQAKSITKK